MDVAKRRRCSVSEVDPVTEAFLLPIVVEAMKAPLPTHWKEFEDP